ncbi:23S rRNA (uracil(1939)-C(5))-methyltransferase RlmD, partial [Paenibacillus ehimensis]|nr:23S rRNA (uracil(1939)-C(5))-methyltransferase RlmD [Paenibacillus ehimensis]
PRTGCERPLLLALAEAKPARLVYVSCNPSTLAKDCLVLLGQGYRLDWIQPVDMFPQTVHVEVVCSLIYKGFDSSKC